VWEEDGPLDGFGGRMQNEGPVTIVSSTFVATGGTLAANGAFLVALSGEGCMSEKMYKCRS
jgi:hypothetical protein